MSYHVNRKKLSDDAENNTAVASGGSKYLFVPLILHTGYFYTVELCYAVEVA